MMEVLRNIIYYICNKSIDYLVLRNLYIFLDSRREKLEIEEN